MGCKAALHAAELGPPAGCCHLSGVHGEVWPTLKLRTACGSSPPSCCSTCLTAMPSVHRPCRMGLSKPAACANSASACSGLVSPDRRYRTAALQPQGRVTARRPWAGPRPGAGTCLGLTRSCTEASGARAGGVLSAAAPRRRLGCAHPVSPTGRGRCWRAAASTSWPGVQPCWTGPSRPHRGRRRSSPRWPAAGRSARPPARAR